MKKKALVLSAAFLCFLLAACTDVEGTAPDQKEVLEKVDAVCVEPYELVDVVQTEERPEAFEYTFVTERGLSFTANSYLQQVYIDATATGFYTPTVSVNYPDAVRELYRDRITDILDACLRDKYSGLAVLSFEDVAATAQCLARADAVYAEELEWNNAQFLIDHPFATVYVYWYPDEQSYEDTSGRSMICAVAINGSWTPQTMYDFISENYAQKCVDGVIADRGDVPPDLLQNAHVSRLTTITLDGRPMTYDTLENKAASYGLSTDQYCFSWYSRNRDSYMLVCDVGFVSESQSYPLIVAEYVTALGGTYQVSEAGFSANWTIDGVAWEMNAQYDDHSVQNLTVTRNNTPLVLDYVTVDEEIEVGATFCVGLPVDQFAQLFDLSYEIDEENQCLAFLSS